MEQEDQLERMRKAVKAFRKMQPSLTAYARALTGNPKVRVVLSSSSAMTDGTNILYRPPLALGDPANHDKRVCDKRDPATSLQLCKACAVREEVYVNILHEIGHIAFDTFAKADDHAKETALLQAASEMGEKYRDALLRRFKGDLTDSYLGLSGLINPYLRGLYGAVEDARVDAAMFRARPGIRIMMQASTVLIFRDGTDPYSTGLKGEDLRWSDAPLNAQAAIACLCRIDGYVGWEPYLNPDVVRHTGMPNVEAVLSKLADSRSVDDTFRLTLPLMEALREYGYFQKPEEIKEPDPPPPPASESNDDDSSDDDTEDSDGTGGDDEGDAPDSPSDDDTQDGDGSPSDEEDEKDGDVGDQGEEPDSDSGPGAPGEDGSGGSDQQQDSGQESSSDSDGDEGQSSGDGSGSDAGEPGSGGGDSSNLADDGGDSPEGESHDDPSQQGDDPEDDSSDGSGGGGAGTDGVPESGESPGGESDDSSSRTDTDAGTGGGADGDEAEQGRPDGDSEASDQDDASESGLPSGDHSDEGSDGSSSDEDAGDAASPDGDGREGDDDGEVAEEKQASTDDTDDTEPSSPEESSPPPPDHKHGVDGEPCQCGHCMVYGSAEDMEQLVHQLHEVIAQLQQGADLTADPFDNADTDDNDFTVYIEQAEHMDTPSVHIEKVFVHHVGDMQAGHFFRSNPEDVEIPESAVGGALLHARKAFSDNNRASQERNLRRGKVHSGALGRRAWQNDPRMFQKRRHPGSKDYSVLIGIDLSTSSNGRIHDLIRLCAMAQADMLHRLGIRFAVYGHSGNRYQEKSYSGTVLSSTEAMDIIVIKTFDDPWSTDTKNIMKSVRPHGANLDGHTLEFYRKRLDEEHTTDRIIMYYTDGLMPYANKDEELEVLEREIKVCARKGYILMGVEVGERAHCPPELDTCQVIDESDIRIPVKHLEKRLAQR